MMEILQNCRTENEKGGLNSEMRAYVPLNMEILKGKS